MEGDVVEVDPMDIDAPGGDGTGERDVDPAGDDAAATDRIVDGPISLFDPNRLDVPDREELIARSAWVGEIPGLEHEARSWIAEVSAGEERLMGRARRLARSRVDPTMIAGIGHVAGNLVAVGVGDLASAIGDRRGRSGSGRSRRRRNGDHGTTPVDDVGAAGDDAGGAGDAAGGAGGEGRSTGGTRSADRIERLVRAGGPAWVKLGQFIATADGLVPDEWVQAFAWCRDEVPQLPPKVPRKRIRKAFGRPVEELFATFDDQPIGAASIAQVHGATLPDGRDVVVKIRRPHLRRRFAADIRAMAAAAWVGERLHPIARAGNPTGFVDLFAQLVLEELDFRIEALNMVELGAVAEAAGSELVRFPRPVPGMVTDSVMVMERVPGVAYTSATVDHAVGERLLRFAIQSVLEHTLIHGVFHGDLHAGNVLLDADDGMLALVDFGIVGRLSVDQRISLGQFLVGFAHMDVRAQLEAMVDFGAIPPSIDLGALEADIEREVRPHDLPEDSDIGELTARIAALIQVVSRHGVSLPKELVLFFKNLLYLNGFATAVAPEANLLGEIVPVFGYFQAKYGEAIDLRAFAAGN